MGYFALDFAASCTSVEAAASAGAATSTVVVTSTVIGTSIGNCSSVMVTSVMAASIGYDSSVMVTSVMVVGTPVNPEADKPSTAEATTMANEVFTTFMVDS